MDQLLSIVIPSYNEEESIDHTVQVILGIVDKANIPCEIIFLSDGSQDKTFQMICLNAEKDKRIKAIEFSRNFGKEAAIFAGLSKSRGDCCVIMDCDLQHPPEKIVEMWKLWLSGYKIVEGFKESRGHETWVYRIFTKFFYRILSKITGFNINNSSDFKLIDREVVKVLLGMPERRMFFRALSFWTGFSAAHVYYKVAERCSGQSKWSTFSLFKYAIFNIISFTSSPLYIISYIGGIIVVCTTIIGLQTLINWMSGDALEGFTTVILLQLFLGGILFVCLGIIGIYLAAIYEEIKQRPRYIISRGIGFESDDGFNEQHRY